MNWSRPAWREILLILSLCVVVVIPFSPALKAGFTNWDDPVNVLENPYVCKGFYGGLLPLVRGTYGALYVPLTYVVYWAEFQLWGDNSFGYHAVNILVHAINVALVYWLFRRLLSARACAFMAALWWGTHPVNVEPVAWVTGLKDILSTSLTLISLCSYVAWREDATRTINKTRRMWLLIFSFAAFALACFSKPGVAAFPLVLVAYDLFMARRTWKELWPAIPYFALTVLIIVVTISVQMIKPEDVPTTHLSGRLLVAGDASLFYLQKIFWPVGLSPVYWRNVDEVVAARTSWLRLIAVAIICVGALFAGRRWRFGVAVFLAGFAPISGLVPFGYQIRSTVADRYIYFSGLGVALVLGDIISRFGSDRHGHSSKNRTIAVATLLCWALVLGGLTWKQTQIWLNSVTLWQRVLKVQPRVTEAHYHLGRTFAEQGDYDRAIQCFTHALEFKAYLAESYYYRGLAQRSKGNYDEAIEDFCSAIDVKSDYAEAYNSRGVARRQKGEIDEAISDYSHAIGIRNDYVEAYINRGIARRNKGDFAGAIHDYSRAIEIKSDYADAYAKRAVLYYFEKMYTEAWNDVKQCQALGRPVDSLFLETFRKDSNQ